MELHTYYGMASSNGLESFFRDETNEINTTALGNDVGDLIYGKEGNLKNTEEIRRNISGMVMAAQANPQRRSVAFRALVSPEVAEEIKEIMKFDAPTALLMLKSDANQIALAQGVPMAKRNWEAIPDSKLDPFN